MDPSEYAGQLKAHFADIRQCIEQALGNIKAAEASLAAGNIEQASSVALDIEEQTYDIDTLLRSLAFRRRKLGL